VGGEGKSQQEPSFALGWKFFRNCTAKRFGEEDRVHNLGPKNEILSSPRERDWGTQCPFFLKTLEESLPPLLIKKDWVKNSLM